MPSYYMRYLPLGSSAEVFTTVSADNAREAFRKLPAFSEARITSGWRAKAGKVSGQAYAHQQYLERIQK